MEPIDRDFGEFSSGCRLAVGRLRPHWMINLMERLIFIGCDVPTIPVANSKICLTSRKVNLIEFDYLDSFGCAEIAEITELAGITMMTDEFNRNVVRVDIYSL